MRTLTAIALFLGVALFTLARLWPPQAPFAQSFPSDVVGMTALWTPLLATWLMPTRLSLLIYPVAVVMLWVGAGHAGEGLISAPSAEEAYLCGMASFAVLMCGTIGIATGVAGRALGLALRGRLKSGLATYFVQLIPLGLIVLLPLLAAAMR